MTTKNGQTVEEGVVSQETEKPDENGGTPAVPQETETVTVQEEKSEQERRDEIFRRVAARELQRVVDEAPKPTLEVRDVDGHTVLAVNIPERNRQAVALRHQVGEALREAIEEAGGRFVLSPAFAKERERILGEILSQKSAEAAIEHFGGLEGFLREGGSEEVSKKVFSPDSVKKTQEIVKATVKLDTGELVDKEAFEELSEAQQQDLRELGTEEFNLRRKAEQEAREKELERQQEEFKAGLTPKERGILERDGIEGLNTERERLGNVLDFVLEKAGDEQGRIVLERAVEADINFETIQSIAPDVTKADWERARANTREAELLGNVLDFVLEKAGDEQGSIVLERAVEAGIFFETIQSIAPDVTKADWERARANTREAERLGNVLDFVLEKAGDEQGRIVLERAVEADINLETVQSIAPDVTKADWERARANTREAERLGNVLDFLQQRAGTKERAIDPLRALANNINPETLRDVTDITDEQLNQAQEALASLSSEERAILGALGQEELTQVQRERVEAFDENTIELPDGVIVIDDWLQSLPQLASTALQEQGSSALDVTGLADEQKFERYKELGFIPEKAVFVGVDEEGNVLYSESPPSRADIDQLSPAEVRKLYDEVFPGRDGFVPTPFVPEGHMGSTRDELMRSQIKMEMQREEVRNLVAAFKEPENLKRIGESLIPIYGTVKFWNEMSPAWRGVSIVSDLLILAPIGKAVVSGLKIPAALVKAGLISRPILKFKPIEAGMTLLGRQPQLKGSIDTALKAREAYIKAAIEARAIESGGKLQPVSLFLPSKTPAEAAGIAGRRLEQYANALDDVVKDLQAQARLISADDPAQAKRVLDSIEQMKSVWIRNAKNTVELSLNPTTNEITKAQAQLTRATERLAEARRQFPGQPEKYLDLASDVSAAQSRLSTLEVGSEVVLGTKARRLQEAQHIVVKAQRAGRDLNEGEIIRLNRLGAADIKTVSQLSALSARVTKAVDEYKDALRRLEIIFPEETLGRGGAPTVVKPLAPVLTGAGVRVAAVPTRSGVIVAAVPKTLGDIERVSAAPVKPLESPQIRPLEQPKITPNTQPVHPAIAPSIQPVHPAIAPSIQPVQPEQLPSEAPRVTPTPSTGPKPKEFVEIAPAGEPFEPFFGPVVEPDIDPFTELAVSPGTGLGFETLVSPDIEPFDEPAPELEEEPVSGRGTGTPIPPRTLRPQERTPKTRRGPAIGFKLPNGQRLQPGIYPVVVQWNQGLTTIRANIDTGRIEHMPFAGGSRRPKESFRVISTDDSKPSKKDIDIGAFLVVVFENRLEFRPDPKEGLKSEKVTSKGIRHPNPFTRRGLS